MKNLSFTFAITFVFISLISACSHSPRIADPKDYDVFLQQGFHQEAVNRNENEIRFWQQKLATDTGNYVYLLETAYNRLAHFKLKGDISDVMDADSLFLSVNQKLNGKEASVFFALAQSAITQHQFKQAANYLLQAGETDADPYTVALLQFDIQMELGHYDVAEQALNTISKREQKFDYLIRKAKLEDHFGRAESSIKNMEKAYQLAKKTNKKSLLGWLTTNLGDMYGHSGRIPEAYIMYLESLALDSANLYALKGIAHIQFAYYRNAEEAKRIYLFIQSTTQAPDLYLNLAEMAEYEGKEEESKEYIQKFITQIEGNPLYGNMYNKYLIDIYIQQGLNTQKGLLIAESEMNNRKTPETYAWLALAYDVNNQEEMARKLIEEEVLNKTHEPHSLYAAAVVLSKSDKQASEKLRKICLESEFELGPMIAAKLKKGI